MNEEQKEQTTQLVNNELTERVNKAYVANGYTLLNGGTDNVVMIYGDKDDKKVDMLLTLEGMAEVVEQLKKEISNNGNKVSSDTSEPHEL